MYIAHTHAIHATCRRYDLTSEIERIFKEGWRVSKFLLDAALLAPLDALNTDTLLSVVRVVKSVNTRFWWDSPLVARQLEGIGPKLARQVIGTHNIRCLHSH